MDGVGVAEWKIPAKHAKQQPSGAASRLAVGPRLRSRRNAGERLVAVRQRHIPLRRCVSCGTRLPQRELVRIVRSPEGHVGVDSGPSRMNGRGTYLCHALACWEQALKKDRLGYALRGSVSPEDRRRLEEYARDMAGTA